MFKSAPVMNLEFKVGSRASQQYFVRISSAFACLACRDSCAGRSQVLSLCCRTPAMAAHRFGPSRQVLHYYSCLQFIFAMHGALSHLSAPDGHFGWIPHCKRTGSTGAVHRLSGTKTISIETIAMTVISISELWNIICTLNRVSLNAVLAFGS
jgi:hypothetical protein